MNDFEMLKKYGKFNNPTKRVTIFLMNGYQLRATIEEVGDNAIAIIDEDGNSQVLYKHAISTFR